MTIHHHTGRGAPARGRASRRRRRLRRGRHRRLPDARPGLDPLRAARLPRLQGRDGEALPRLHGDLPERQRRRRAPAAAVQLGARPRAPRSIVLDPVDSAAAASLVKLAQSQGVKVIAYDRPIPDVPADYYVSFDNEGIGKAIAESLVQHLEGAGVAKDKGGILQINGSPTDAAAGLIRDGIHEGLDASGYKTLAEFDTPDWAPPKAQEWTSGQITRFGAEIVGRRRGQRRHRRRRHRRLQGRRRQSGAAGHRQRRDDRRAAARSSRATSTTPSPSRPRSSPPPPPRSRSSSSTARRRSRRPTLYDTPVRSSSCRRWSPAENIKAEIFDKGINTAAEICTGALCRRLQEARHHSEPPLTARRPSGRAVPPVDTGGPRGMTDTAHPAPPRAS